MKILIITNSFPPYNAIASLRPYSWAKYWTQWGHTVTVLTTAKRHSEQDLTLANNGFNVIEVDYMSEHPFFARLVPPQEVAVRSTSKGAGISASAKPSVKKRIRKLIGGFFKDSGAITNDCRMPNVYQLWPAHAVREILRIGEHYDVAVATFAPFATFKIGYELKKEGIVSRLVFDYRDLWLESPFKGVFGFRSIERAKEKKWAAYADAITTVSDPLAETLSSKFRRDVSVVLNGFDLDDLNNLEPVNVFKADEINIMYAGSLYGNFRDPEPVFAALASLRDRNVNISKIHLYFASGNAVERINELKHKYQLEKVTSLGFLPRKQILHLQKEANILLFLSHNGKEGKGFLGGKLSEYLFSNTFVWVIGGEGDPAVIFEKYGHGKFLGNDVELISDNMRSVIDGTPPVVKDNPKDIELFTREYQARKMLSICEK